MNAYRDAGVSAPPRFVMTIRLIRPALLLVPWALLALAFLVAKLDTHRTEIRCTADACVVIETRAGIELGRRTVARGSEITLRPRSDGGTNAMFGDRILATFPPGEVREAHRQLVLRGLGDTEANVTVERPFDHRPWTRAALLLSAMCLVALWFFRREVVVDHGTGVVRMHREEFSLSRVVGVRHNSDLQVVVTLTGGEERTLFPAGRTEREVARLANELRVAIRRTSAQ